MRATTTNSPQAGAQEPVVTIIKRRRGLSGLGLGEMWRYRELLYFFTWRDVKVRYKQTVFGAAWAVLQPFMMMVVFSIFLGRLAKVPSDGFPYPVFAYSGLVPWTLFASSMSGASTSLVDGSNLVSKVYFPRLIMPIAAAGSFVLDFAIALSLLFVMMVYYGITPTAAVVWLPLLTLFALIVALAVGVWLSSLNVKYRDIRYALPFVVQLWLFATPVAYPSALVPDRWRPLIGLNPMSGVIEGFRWALLGTGRPDKMIFISALVTVVVLFGGLAYFRKSERTFADWI